MLADNTTVNSRKHGPKAEWLRLHDGGQGDDRQVMSYDVMIPFNTYHYHHHRLKSDILLLAFLFGRRLKGHAAASCDERAIC